MSNEITPAQSYAIYRLIASHWYRIAYPIDQPAYTRLTRRERVARYLAEHYDTLAAQMINPESTLSQHNPFLNEALEIYHNLYTLWRDNRFDHRMFESMTNRIRSTF